MPDLDRMKLAFAVSVANAVVAADEYTDYGEFRLLGEIFPRPLLADHGFVDSRGRFTPALEDAAAEARALLPGALSREEKLDVLTIFYGTAIADDTVDTRELDVIREAAKLLGIKVEELTAHLAEVRAKEETP